MEQKNILCAVVVSLIVGGLIGWFAHASVSTTKMHDKKEMTHESNHMVSDDTPINIIRNEEDRVHDFAVAGVVTKVDTEQAAFDGPVRIFIDEQESTKRIVAVPSMGVLHCAAKDNIADVWSIKVGDKIQALGTVGPSGELVPCESPDHFLTVVE